MKKLFVFAVMAMLAVAVQAQIVSSRSTGITRIEQPKNGWSTLGVQYLPGTFDPKHGDSKSCTGLALEWTKATGLTNELPLYLEAGIGAQWSNYSESAELTYYNGYSYSAYTYDEKLNMISVKVPVNLVYSYQIPNTNITLDPYLGLRSRVNVWGQLDEDGSDLNVFDKDDMGDSDSTWNRFQIGWQIGAKVRFGGFFVGAAYGTDFSDIVKDVTVKEGQLSVGLVF